MKSGILVDGKLQLPAFDHAVEEQIAREVMRDAAHADDKEHSLEVKIGGVPHFSSSSGLICIPIIRRPMKFAFIR